MYQLLIFDYVHIVLNYLSHCVYSPLNSYVYIHWILDFKYILILLLQWKEKITICNTQYYITFNKTLFDTKHIQINIYRDLIITQI